MSRINLQLMAGLLLLPLVAAAGAPSSSQDDLEPAVDTSHPAPQTTAPASTPALKLAPAASASATASAAAAAHGGKARAAGTRPDAGDRTMDRVDLDATRITGNSELPKVMYVVPWKHSDAGDAVGRPANSLIDEVLEPVDRDVFNRENRYYRELPPEPQPRIEPRAGSGGRKDPGGATAGGTDGSASKVHE